MENLPLIDKYLLILFKRASEKNISIDDYLDSLFKQITQKIENDNSFAITISDKVNFSKYLLKKGIQKFGIDNTVLAWTGGKDSTLILWMVKELCEDEGWELPHCMFINEGHVFEEISEFVKDLSTEWNLDITEVKNDDVANKAKKVGDLIKVKDLDKRNQEEVSRVGYQKKTFPFEPESIVGNHLMKTVAMNRYLENTKYKAVITGIRWDEQDARAQETFFSNRGDEYTPYHIRIHPILHFDEKDIWDATHQFKIPYCSLYEKGFRSLGAKGTTTKADDKPAWEQDFDKISERAGRRQDKEGLMKKLRDLGYM